MKPSVKAALLSALVFPGVGHIYLKRYATGIVLIIVAVVATYYLMANAVHIAFAISDRITSGEVPLETTAISNLVEQQTQQVTMSSSVTTWILCIAWLVGIADSYRVGLKKENQPVLSAL